MRKRPVLAWMLPLALVACAGKGPLQGSDSADACTELVMPMKPRVSKLPTGGAIMESATPVAASVPASGVDSAGTPGYCRVLGRIAAVDPAAPPIRFQVDLPTQWNGRAVQYGSRPQPADPALSPLTQGYATYTNDEAPPHTTYDVRKKVRDVAVQLTMRGYGRGPQKVYFIGGSEGGREGLALAHTFPNDYDGVVSAVRPASAPADPVRPDLSDFQRRGGKLLLLEPAAEAAPGAITSPTAGPTAGTVYRDLAVAQFGPAKTDDFMRLYTVPADVNPAAQADLLGTLAAWVEHDKAPAAQRCLPTLPPKEPPCP
jgi:hypothetical protein